MRSAIFFYATAFAVFLSVGTIGFADPQATVPPPDDINKVAVFTMNEMIDSDALLTLGHEVGTDMLIRGWFKWHQAPHFERMGELTAKAHRMGMLFGGGITCSALYEGENGLPMSRVLDMATRGAEGQLIDAWKTPHCRHGTLSNPAYLEYLLSWCKAQIDGGVDYLFMDEPNAALHPNEGFDDYSIADFRKFLLDRYAKQDWTPTDRRWRDVFKIDLADSAIAPDHTMKTFQYRAYLKAFGVSKNLNDVAHNALHHEWPQFVADRNDRVWKSLVDAIRAYAASKHRRVYISGNGLIRYVDLQVLGVWGDWTLKDDRVDFSKSQIERWRATVVNGREMAEKRVPVVLFHDWGFDGFPWMKVSADDRRLWMRIRGPEIYAAGGFFAFPVHGPGAFDARTAGTFDEIKRQTKFFRQNKDLYLNAEFLGFEPLETDDADLSLALWKSDAPRQLILHAINRQNDGVQPKRRQNVCITLPTDQAPKSVRVVSPDWEGERQGDVRVENGRVSVVFPQLDAYAVAVLSYDALPPIKMIAPRVVPALLWNRPVQNEFTVESDGSIRRGSLLPGVLQGRLHAALRNPPTFMLDMKNGGCLKVHVLGVAMGGAKLEWGIDGQIAKTIDLPDLDGKNDMQPAEEYNRTFEFSIPPGRHRATLDNVGRDWASIGWYRFERKP